MHDVVGIKQGVSRHQDAQATVLWCGEVRENK